MGFHFTRSLLGEKQVQQDKAEKAAAYKQHC